MSTGGRGWMDSMCWRDAKGCKKEEAASPCMQERRGGVALHAKGDKKEEAASMRSAAPMHGRMQSA